MSTRDLKTSPFASLLALLGLVALCACQPTEPSPTDSFAPSPSPVPREPSPLNVAPPIQQQCHGVEAQPRGRPRGEGHGQPARHDVLPRPRRIPDLRSTGAQGRSGADRGLGDGSPVISGAKVVTASKQGSYWVITGQTSLGTTGVSPLTRLRPGGWQHFGRHVHLRDQAFLNGRSCGKSVPSASSHPVSSSGTTPRTRSTSPMTRPGRSWS